MLDHKHVYVIICSTVTVVPVIGSKYFCESGNSGNSWSHVLYTSNPLWDRQSYEVL